MKRLLSLFIVGVLVLSLPICAMPSAVTVGDLAKEFVSEAYSDSAELSADTSWYDTVKGKLLFHMDFEENNNGGTVTSDACTDMIGQPSSNGKPATGFGKVNPNVDSAASSLYNMSFRYVDGVSIGSEGSNNFIQVSTLENTYVSMYFGNVFTETGTYTIDFKYKYVPDSSSTAHFYYLERKTPAGDAISDMVTGEWTDMSITYDVTAATDIRLNFTTKDSTVYSTNDMFFIDDVKIYKYEEPPVEEEPTVSTKWYNIEKGNLLFNAGFDTNNEGGSVTSDACTDMIGTPSSNGKLMSLFGEVNPYAPTSDYNMSFRYVDGVSIGSEGDNQFMQVSTLENTYVSMYFGNVFTEAATYTIEFKYKYVPDSASTANFYYLERKTPADDAIGEMVTGEWTDMSITYDVTAATDIRLNFTTKDGTTYSTNDMFFIDDIKVYKMGDAFDGSLDEPDEPEQPEEPEEPAVETVKVTVMGGVNTLAGDKVIAVPKGDITIDSLKSYVVDHGDMILTGLSLTENGGFLSGSLTLTEDMTVYAHWQKTGEILDEYSVEFEFDESSGNDIMWNYTGRNASTVTGHGYSRHKDGYGSLTFNAVNDHIGIWDSNIRVTNQAGKIIEKGKIKGIMIRMRYRNIPTFTCNCKTDKHNHTFQYDSSSGTAKDVVYTNNRHMFQIYYLNNSADALSENQSLRLRYNVYGTEIMNQEWFTLYFDVSENADFQENDIAYLRYDFENGIWDNMIIDLDYIRLIGDKSYAPETVDVNEIKTTKPMGVRFMASLTKEIQDSATSYGWIFARETALSASSIENKEFTYEAATEAGVATLRDVNFGEGRDEALIYNEDGANIYFTALLYNIPQSGYTDKIVARPFAVVGDLVYYGDYITKSMYDVALAIKADGFRGHTAAQQSYIQRVIDIVEEN
ncbi:MAG: hypothetical protein J6E38_04745 [Clostridia bacterium]|nr:hypothetical protein [Clostridia bacterium]